MKTVSGLISCMAICVFCISGCSQQNTNSDNQTGGQFQLASGTVYDDANGNSIRDGWELGLPGVRVSNGRDVVKTDMWGRYHLPVDDDTTIFVIKPKGWMTQLNEFNQPRSYYIHKPNGSPDVGYAGVAPTGPLPESIDFPLRRHFEFGKFKVLMFGDPQPWTQDMVDFLAHDLVEECIGTDALFGASLGDLVSDRLEFHEPVVKVMAQIGIPWYSILGNHDENYGCPDDSCSTESFQRVFGPPYYSFDYSSVHFIVLDDIVWHGKTEEKRGYYTCGLGPEQMEFIRNDLALLPKSQLVVLMMHIPIVQLAEAEKKELFGMLAKHPHTFSLSAHTHTQEHRFLGEDDFWPGKEPHHHLIHVTACGSWWAGARDEYSLPHTTMRDGAPNGYSVITFDGNDYSIEFKAARRPADHQMYVNAPEVVSSADAAQTEILVNVFAGSERSTVMMRMDGQDSWVDMKQTDRLDPNYVRIVEVEGEDGPPNGRKMPKPARTPHLWAATLPDGLSQGVHLIHVRTTDMFGHTYDEYRTIRVE